MRKNRLLFRVGLTFSVLSIAGTLVFGAPRGFIPGTNNDQRISQFLTISNVGVQLLSVGYGREATVVVRYTLDDTQGRDALWVGMDVYDPDLALVSLRNHPVPYPTRLGLNEASGLITLEFASNYTFLVSALDNDAPDEIWGRNRPALERATAYFVHPATCFGTEDTYTVDNANRAYEELGAVYGPAGTCTLYSGYAPLGQRGGVVANPTKDMILVSLQEDAVFLFDGHGWHDNMGLLVYLADVQALPSDALDQLRLAVVNSCAAAMEVWDPDGSGPVPPTLIPNNIAKELVAHGVDAVTAFKTSVDIEAGPGDLWDNRLWYYLTKTEKTVSEAIDSAKRDMRNYYGNDADYQDSGYASATVLGNPNETIYPAGWGN